MILMGKRQRGANSLAQNYFLPQQACHKLLFMEEAGKATLIRIGLGAAPSP